MTDSKQKKPDERKSGINPVAAVVTGAVGVGIAVAGMVALKDEKNRKKVKEVLTNIKNQATDYMENMQKQAQDKKSEVEKKLASGKEKIKKIENIVKD